eukprot:m.143536 g.143536  ORF g.143536 m.143536 type:complete len:227 (+) comp13207_c0_seq10:2331-3011(+)
MMEKETMEKDVGVEAGKQGESDSQEKKTDHENCTIVKNPQHEEDVLHAIFNPEMPFGAPRETTTQRDDDDLLVDYTEEEKAVDEAVKAEEKEAVRLAEDQKCKEALAIFDKLVSQHPERAKGYNNRAQLHQLMGNKEAALKDVDFAIQNCRLSRGVAQRVFAQRGALKRLCHDDEGARLDFEMAGKYGNAWAKQQAVLLNPYAAMCNQMLTQALNKMKQEQPSNTQ